MIPLLLAGGALSAGGAAASYFGGRNEADRRQAAIDAYQARAAKLYEQMAKDAWAKGSEYQKATGDVIGGLRGVMSRPASAAPVTGDFMPASTGPNQNPEFLAAMRQAIMPMSSVQDAQLADAQTGADAHAMSREMGDNEALAGMTPMAKSVGHARYQWLKQRQLEEARAQLEAVLGTTSNKTRNLQLLGSGLSSLGGMAMMGAAFSGGPAAGGAAGAATYGGGSMPGPAVAQTPVSFGAGNVW